jgi:hypothetical protein
VVKIEVVLKDVGARDNDAKIQVLQEYFLAQLRTKLWKMCF